MQYVLKNGRPIFIRRATVDDAKVIVEIVNQVASEEYYLLWDKRDYDIEVEKKHITKVGTGNNLIVVAEVDGQIVGVGELKSGVFKKNRHTAELGITLLKAFRHLGAGRALIERIVSWAKEKGLEKLCLSVFSTNQSAIRLYEKFGFQIEAVRKRQFKTDRGYMDEILMALFLSARKDAG